jgi:PAS domain S-box-containing protein
MNPHGDLGLVTGGFCWMLVHSGPDAIICIDRGGLIRFWNASAEKIFGYAAREVIGKPFDIVIASEHRRPNGHAWSTKPTENTNQRHGLIVMRGQRKDGTRLSIEAAIFSHRNDDGDLVGLALILRDVTQRAQKMKRTPCEASTALFYAAVLGGLMHSGIADHRCIDEPRARVQRINARY